MRDVSVHLRRTERRAAVRFRKMKDPGRNVAQEKMSGAGNMPSGCHSERTPRLGTRGGLEHERSLLDLTHVRCSGSMRLCSFPVHGRPRPHRDAGSLRHASAHLGKIDEGALRQRERAIGRKLRRAGSGARLCTFISRSIVVGRAERRAFFGSRGGL